MRSNLKAFREKLGFTQAEIGAMFKMNRQQWCNIEQGRRIGSAIFWLKLQQRFKLSNSETLKLMEVSDERA